MSCDTCFTGHLGRRIRWWHSFLKLTRGKVNFRSNWAKLGQISNFKILSPKYAHLVQFCLRIPKLNLFLCTTIKNAKNFISNMWPHYLYLFFWPLRSKNKDIAWKLCMRVVCMYPITYTAVFWMTLTPFSKKNYRWIFMKFWWQTSNWCWGRYWEFRVDICRCFWDTEKIRQEMGGGSAPSGARVKLCHLFERIFC